MTKLADKCVKLLDLYHEIKREVRTRDPHLYERWKASGFLVDDSIVSMYPSLTEVMDFLEEGDDEEDDSDSDESDDDE